MLKLLKKNENSKKTGSKLCMLVQPMQMIQMAIWYHDCTKPFYAYGAAYRINFCDWFFCCELQVHESFFHKEQLVTIARIQMVWGVCCFIYSHPLWKWMFFHNNSFQVSSKSALNIFAFLPHPEQKCEILVFSLTCHFKSCQFQLLR